MASIKRYNSRDSEVDSVATDNEFNSPAVQENGDDMDRYNQNGNNSGLEEDHDDPHTFDYSSDGGIDKYRKMFKKKLTLNDSRAASDSEDTDVEDSWLDKSEFDFLENRNGFIPAENSAFSKVQQKNQPPQKPPRRRLPRLPSQINDAWLQTLILATVPSHSVHYKDKQLQASIRQLMTMINQDDPVEEYKVRVAWLELINFMR